MVGDRAHLLVGDERAVDAGDLLAAGHVEHVALAEQLLGALLAEDGAAESILLVTWKLMRVGRFALITPVMTSTDGRWVAMIRWMPAARAFCASRWIRNSTSLPAVIIRSASSSTITTICGSGVIFQLFLS